MKIALAEFVWQRARDCCEYCRMPQAYDEIPFAIDHVIAEQQGGKTIASNLALACFADRSKVNYEAVIHLRVFSQDSSSQLRLILVLQ